MGKASRQRRLKKERERQRQRAQAQGSSAGTRPGARPGAGYGGAAGNGRGKATDQAYHLLGKALSALSAGRDAAVERHLDELAAERVPGWSRAVSSATVQYLRAAVQAAWRGGWQPAELVRHVGRERSAAHAAMMADIIADEARDYAAATVDPRWAQQVKAASDRGAWWGDSADYLAAWREQARDPDPTAAVRVAVETLGVMMAIPALEPLMPLPGTYRAPAAAASAASGAAADERMLSRIRALLAKAESTEFAEEAEALSARAQELMAKYSIDQALLAAQAGDKESASGRRIAVDSPYEEPKVSLLNVVAEANRCRAIWSKDVGMVTVVGFAADLDAVELLFTSLLVQANTAMLRAGAKRDAVGRSRTRAFRQSFLISYSVRIGERLDEAAGHAVQEAAAEQASRPAGTDLVPFLAARQEAVDEAVDEIFGDSLYQGRRLYASDAEGWASGRAAADLASLHSREAVAG